MNKNNYIFKKILFLTLTICFYLKSHANSLAVVNKESGSVSFVSVDQETVTEINVGYLPHEIAVNSTHAFVSNYGHQHVRSTSLKNIPGNTISMIELSNPSFVEEIDLGVGKCAPHGIEASADDRYVFVTCEGRQEIAVINTRQRKVEKFLRTNQAGSHMLTLGPNNKLFVTNFWIGTVSVIDVSSGKLEKQIFTGKSTEGIGISPDHRFLYVTVVESNELVKISVDTLNVDLRVKLPERTSPIRVLVSNDSSKLVVNHSAKNTTGIYDANTMKLIDEIPVGKQPIGLALSRKSNHAYVANMKDGSVSFIDLNTHQNVKTMNSGFSRPDGLVVIN